MITLQLLNDASVVRELAGFQKKIRDRVLKPMVQNVGRLVASAASGLVPKQTGLLQRSIGVSSVKIYKGTGQNAVFPDKNVTGKLGSWGPAETVFVAVGPRRGFGRMVTKGKGGRLKASGKGKGGDFYRDPVRYGHLVEEGHRVASGGTLERVGKSRVLNKYGLHNQFETRTVHYGITGISKVTGKSGGGRSIGMVPPRPFMAPAAAAVEPAARAMAAELLGPVIAEESARLTR